MAAGEIGRFRVGSWSIALTTPTDRHGSLRATPSGTKAVAPTTGVLLQKDASQADDEVQQSSVCPAPTTLLGPWTILRVDVQGQRQNRQCEAHSGSNAFVWGRLSRVSKTEVPCESPRTAVANCPAASGQAGTTPASRLIADRGYSNIPPSGPGP